jgi:hypothetical protein
MNQIEGREHWIISSGHHPLNFQHSSLQDSEWKIGVNFQYQSSNKCITNFKALVL